MKLSGIAKILAVNIGLWLLLELCAFVILFLTPPEPDQRAKSRNWVSQAQLSFSGGLYTWDDYCLWRLSPGYETPNEAPARFWGDGPLRINSQGMRGPERSVKKPDGVKRILIVGGSHPMGMYVNYAQTYGAVIEQELNRQGDVRWQVLNAAAPGHTSFQVRRYLEKYALKYAPDIVISDVGVNDTLPLSAEFPLPDHEVNTPPAWAVQARPILEVSAVYRLLRRWLQPSPARSRASAQDSRSYGVRVPREKHTDNLNAMKTLAKTNGFNVLYLGQVSVDLQNSGRSTCVYADTEHEPHVDLCAFWQSYGADAGRYFADPIHANPDGHAMIADKILSKLRSLDWVQREEQ